MPIPYELIDTVVHILFGSKLTACNAPAYKHTTVHMFQWPEATCELCLTVTVCPILRKSGEHYSDCDDPFHNRPRVQISNVAEIVEENGKTWLENNLGLGHNIPVGALVEVKYDKWHGDGACERIHARLFVHKHARDCDGSPIYTLIARPNLYAELISYETPNHMIVNAMSGVEGGFSEEQLTVIEVTPEIRRGEGALSWRDGG